MFKGEKEEICYLWLLPLCKVKEELGMRGKKRQNFKTVLIIIYSYIDPGGTNASVACGCSDPEKGNLVVVKVKVLSNMKESREEKRIQEVERSVNELNDHAT